MTRHTDADDGRTDYDNDDTVTVPVVPPREPGAYQATRHFSNRLRERVRDADRSNLTRTLIRSGRVSRVRDPDERDVPDADRGTPVGFTTTDVDGRPWTLVAALRPVAFVDDDEQHRALTIFQGTPTRRDDVPDDGGDGHE